jgi:Ca-activated chloride channel homolog
VDRVSLHWPWALCAWTLLPVLYALSRAAAPRVLAARMVSLAALVLALAQPELGGRAGAATVLVVDTSDSIDDATLEVARGYLQGARTPLVTFAGEPRRASAIERAHGDATDIEAALQLAAGLLPARGRVVLFSDGRETRGSLLRAARDLAARSITLFYVSPSSRPPELGIAALTAPEGVQLGAPFELSAQVAASAPGDLTLQLFHDGTLESTRDEHVQSGETLLRFHSRITRPGEAVYRLVLQPHGPDFHAENNTREQRVRVAGRPRVLYLEQERAGEFAALLRSAGFDVDVRQTPPPELSGYDFCVLSDQPADALSPGFVRSLSSYLQAGGGLLVAGGEHAFGPGGYHGTALERLLPVTLQGGDARNEASLALVLAIDKSGSMAGDKLERAKEAALATAALLPADAYLGVIGFDVEATRLVRLSRARPHDTLVQEIGKLGAGGGTALFPALDAAYADLAGVRARVRHLVVLTDGQTQEEALGELVRAMHADGITISTVGLGEDVQRGLLGELAKLARGRAYFTRDPSQVPRLFVEEAERVGRSLVVERAIRARQVGQAAFMRGITIASAPALRGMVSTRARPGAHLILESDAGEPLLARMRVGEGWSLALTTDVKPRWSAPWFAWAAHPQLFAQLVREHMRRPDSQQLALQTQLVGDQLELLVDVIDEQGQFVNELTGTVEVGHDSEPSRSFPLQASAPGRYQARVPAAALGSYRLRARLTSPNGSERRGGTNVSRAFSVEYSHPFAPAVGLLQAAARLTGGGPLPPSMQALTDSRRDAANNGPAPLWPALIWLALATFLVDVALRRLSVAGRRRFDSRKGGA